VSRLSAIAVETISGGAALDHLNAALERISKDVIKRPTLNSPRTVRLTITVQPALVEGSDINLPEIDWNVKHSVPGHKGMTTRGYIEEEQIKINLDDPGSQDPRQMVIPFEQPQTIQKEATE